MPFRTHRSQYELCNLPAVPQSTREIGILVLRGPNCSKTGPSVTHVLMLMLYVSIYGHTAGQCHAGTYNKRTRALNLYLDTADKIVRVTYAYLCINLLVQSQQWAALTFVEQRLLTVRINRLRLSLHYTLIVVKTYACQGYTVPTQT